MSQATIKWNGYIAVSCPAVRKNPHQPGLWKPTANLTVNKPTVDGDTVAVRISIELPAALFQKPQLEARISIPPTAITPSVVDLEVRDNIERLIHEQTGFSVKLVAIGEEGSK